jgi:hypothetical protein
MLRSISPTFSRPGAKAIEKTADRAALVRPSGAGFSASDDRRLA